MAKNFMERSRPRLRRIAEEDKIIFSVPILRLF